MPYQARCFSVGVVGWHPSAKKNRPGVNVNTDARAARDALDG